MEVNVDVVVKMEQDTVLRKITNDADLTLVDGQPLIWLAKLYGRPLKMKVSGSDLVPTLLECAAKEGRSVFVLGGVGALSPSMGFEKKPEEVAYIRETLQKVKPDILLACFGCPKQEKWVSEHYRDCASGVTLCAGATVDFLAGNVKRAPKVFSENGLEWFYRFVKEPKRLFRRYFVDDMQIFCLAWKYRKEQQ